MWGGQTSRCADQCDQSLKKIKNIKKRKKRNGAIKEIDATSLVKLCLQSTESPEGLSIVS